MTRAGRDPLRILVAGAGLFGREHLDRLAARNDVRIAGVSDPSTAARDHVRARYPVEHVFTDALDMLDGTAADGLIVASPSSTHVEITLHAIGRRIAVLLEKPVAPTVEQAIRLAEAAEQAQVLVLPGHVLRHARDHRRLVEIVAAGGIGAPLYVNSRRYRDDSHAERYRNADPVLMTLIHDIDLALWIAAGRPRSARAWRVPDAGFRSMTAAMCVLEPGILCDLRTAWTFAAGELPNDRVEVVGTKGSVELEVGRSLHYFAQGRREEISLSQNDDALVNEQDHFLACLLEKTLRPLLTLRDAATGLGLAARLLESLNSD